MEFSDDFKKFVTDLIRQVVNDSFKEAQRNNTDDKNLSVNEAADLLNVSTRTIRKMVKRGVLTKANPFIKKLTFDKKDLKELNRKK
jgi:excisionase family DNA binding protein